jgi:hypothetical protein
MKKEKNGATRKEEAQRDSSVEKIHGSKPMTRIAHFAFFAADERSVGKHCQTLRVFSNSLGHGNIGLHLLYKIGGNFGIRELRVTDEYHWVEFKAINTTYAKIIVYSAPIFNRAEPHISGVLG